MREELAATQAQAGNAGRAGHVVDRHRARRHRGRNPSRARLSVLRRACRGAVAVGGRGAARTDASPLTDAAIEAIHRIRTDSGRLGETWFLRLREAGLGEAAYVELVSVVAVVTAVDTFRRAAGLDPWPLPAPRDGAPTRHRPRGARPGLGWVATLAPEDVTPEDPDLYRAHPGPRERYGANIHRALSLVPDSMIHWWDMLEAMYQSSAQMRDFGHDYRAVTHAAD